MPLTPVVTRDPGSPAPQRAPKRRAAPPPVRDLAAAQRLPLRCIALALTLGLACAKGATLPDAPVDVLHYPAWTATLGTQLLVVNLDQDMAYQNGALVVIDASPNLAAPPAAAGASNARRVQGGVPVPNMAGQVLVVDAATAGECAAKLTSTYPLPFALVAGRIEDSLYVVPLNGSTAPQQRTRIALNPFSASQPFGLAFTCSADGTPRAWVGFMAGNNRTGYLARVDLSKGDQDPDRVVEVNVGKGPPRSFAYDAKYDRLYFTGREVDESAPIRWIQVGGGCPLAAAGTDGVQDERKGGCHVDAGFDLSAQLRGAEPNDIALSSDEFACTSSPGTSCRRMYLSVRMYDADLAAYLGARPSGDIGGKLMVVELPENTSLSAPEPQVVGDLDIGVMAGPLRVVPRAGGDLIAVTAVDQGLLWLYDDATGEPAKVFGRDATGVPLLGRQPSGIASQVLDGGTVRLFVTSYRDDWVSAIDVPLADPGSAVLKIDELTGYPWRLGVAP